MKHFLFWQRWLAALGLFVVAFGLALAWFNQTPLFDVLFNRQINPVFWSGASLPQGVLAFQSWAYGVLGATMAGWGAFLFYIAAYPFHERQPWAWNCIALGMGLWYLVDTAISYASGVYFNVAFNTLFLLLAGLPLVFTWKAFRPSSE